MLASSLWVFFLTESEDKHFNILCRNKLQWCWKPPLRINIIALIHYFCFLPQILCVMCNHCSLFALGASISLFVGFFWFERFLQLSVFLLQFIQMKVQRVRWGLIGHQEVTDCGRHSSMLPLNRCVWSMSKMWSLGSSLSSSDDCVTLKRFWHSFKSIQH